MQSISEKLKTLIPDDKVRQEAITTILKAVEDSLSVTTAHDVLNATKPYDALVYRASEVQEAIKELKEE